MGTDIHLHVEKKTDGKWEGVQPPYETGYEDWPNSWSPYYENENFDDPRPDPTNRQYNLFAFLADVRNGRGFAGVYTGEPIVPQFPDRGIPEDSTLVDNDGYHVLGDHSFTHASLKELLEAPWDIWFYSGGLVSAEAFLNRDEQGIPPAWCGGVGGDQTNVHDSPEEFQKLIDSGKDMTGYYCRVGWKWQPLMNCGFKRWCFETLKPMVEDPEDLRVLIGFDS